MIHVKSKTIIIIMVLGYKNRFLIEYLESNKVNIYFNIDEANHN